MFLSTASNFAAAENERAVKASTFCTKLNAESLASSAAYDADFAAAVASSALASLAAFSKETAASWIALAIANGVLSIFVVSF